MGELTLPLDRKHHHNHAYDKHCDRDKRNADAVSIDAPQQVTNICSTPNHGGKTLGNLFFGGKHAKKPVRFAHETKLSNPSPRNTPVPRI